MNNIYTLYLKNCTFFANHGAYEVEKRRGQPFFIDVEIDIAFYSGLQNDSLEDTIDYDHVYQIVEKVVTTTRRNLIEVLAMDIINALHHHFKQITRAKIVIRKPKAALQGIIDYVEARVEQSY
ncbi:putative dihydroneopterin aldolase [Liberibacter crescens BT-1]|uniref:7,8-dihydroneopterin aldolase n=1 Tax=Liberibacter crescens (strain BT-1) TaxID=1215343 RepID=L0EV12_LIBCB|nr:dihydroneopterin aldolase [Liberibacter crescens]AGA64802.1 putative dihydroneopterin aldolase [Liberibacter crescens BT-1]AMC12864.1 dienelactone hydrolase [Liberibacter crescens]